VCIEANACLHRHSHICKVFLVGEAEAGSVGEQPARNNQPESHQVDGRGRGRGIAPFQLSGRIHLERLDRPPNASENSCSGLGYLSDRETAFEFSRRDIAQS
jgi:hypothetical protein